MVQKLSKAHKLKEFDIELDLTPQTCESRKLAVPELVHKEAENQKLYACDRLLKQMPVFSCNSF
jgi:hypothetical protein